MLQHLTENLSRIFMILGALVIMAMVLFPPWRYTILLPRRDNIEIPGGYGFIGTPPEPTQSRCPACWYEDRTPTQPNKPGGDELDKLITRLPEAKGTPRQYSSISISMDSERLTVQILGAALVCGLLALAVRKR